MLRKPYNKHMTAQPIADLLRKYLISQDRERDPNRERKYYISDMGKCKRVRWVKRHGVESDFSGYVRWILAIGNLYHDFGYKVLESLGVLLESETYISNNPHFSGRFDGVIKSSVDTKRLFDFKSINGYKLLKVTQGEDVSEYIAQLFTYLILLKDGGRTDLDNTVSLVFLNKEPSEKVPFDFYEREYTLTDWREKQIREELDEMAKYWENDEVPPCTCVGWMKDYNSYIHFCNAEQNQIREWLDMTNKNDYLISTKEGLYLANQLEETRTKLK